MALQIQTPNDYSGKQVLIKSDRLVFNASSNDIILASKGVIAIAAEDQVHINSKGNLCLNVKDGSKIIFGKPGSKTRKSQNQAVLGNKLLNFLEDVMQLLVTLKVVTPGGAGTADPEVSTKIQKLKAKYFKPNSKDYILSDLLYIADNIK
jgi:hypothetical protein